MLICVLFVAKSGFLFKVCAWGHSPLCNASVRSFSGVVETTVASGLEKFYVEGVSNSVSRCV